MRPGEDLDRLGQFAVTSAPDDATAIVDGLATYGVSREALVNRARDLGHLTAKSAAAVKQEPTRSLFARAGRMGDYEQWSHDPGPRPVPARIERRLISAFQQGRIGIGMLAHGMNKNSADLADELAALGIVPDFSHDDSGFDSL